MEINGYGASFEALSRGLPGCDAV